MESVNRQQTQEIQEVSQNITKIETLLNQKFESLENFINNIKQGRKKVTFDFFHPFFSIIMKQYKLLRMSDMYFDKYAKSMVSLFHIKNTEFSLMELIVLFYVYIDEICGLFVYLLDQNFFLTTQIEIMNSEDVKQTSSNKEKLKTITELFGNSTKSEIDFCCRTTLKETFKNGRKMVLEYEIFYVEKNENSQIVFTSLLHGSSQFQQPKVALPMSKF